MLCDVGKTMGSDLGRWTVLHLLLQHVSFAERKMKYHLACWLLLIAGPLLIASCSPAPRRGADQDDTDWDEVAASVTIYRDEYGVPHIYGPTDASVVFGYLYAQAEDNFCWIAAVMNR